MEQAETSGAPAFPTPTPPEAPIPADEAAERLVAPPLPRETRLSIAFLIFAGTIGAGLLFALGYICRRWAAEGTASFTLRDPAGWRFWLPGALLALLMGTVVLLIAGHEARPELPRLTAWIFPTVTIVTGLLVIAVYHERTWWFVAPAVVWLALLIGTIARVLLIESEGFGHDVARTSLTVVTYVVAFIALAMIYINKYRSVFSATAVAIVAFFLLVQASDGEHAVLVRRAVYAMVGALIVGQVTWAINYWSATGWTGGAFLLAVFYLVAGLSAAQLRDRVQAFDIVEFGGVALIALAIVSAAVWFQTQ